MPERRARNMVSKSRRITGNTLILLSCFALLGSAIAKFAQVPAVVGQMSAAGLGGWRLTFVALLEVASAIAFLIPATRSLGLLLVSSFLGGAIATHLQHGQSIVPPSMVLVIAWFAAWVRYPVVLWSLHGEAPGDGVERESKQSIRLGSPA